MKIAMPRFAASYQFIRTNPNDRIEMHTSEISEEMSTLMASKAFGQLGGQSACMNPSSGDVLINSVSRQNPDGSIPRESLLKDARLLNLVANMIDGWTLNPEAESATSARESVNRLLVKAGSHNQTTFSPKERQLTFRMPQEYLFNCYYDENAVESPSDDEINASIL